MRGCPGVPSLVKQPACKPGSVPQVGCLSFIYAMCHHMAKAFYPPVRASNPQAPVYMNLQPPRRTARTSLHGRWALTPPSHPYPCGRLFSSALLHLHKRLSVRKWSALRCPDFPPLHLKQRRQTVRLYVSQSLLNRHKDSAKERQDCCCFCTFCT